MGLAPRGFWAFLSGAASASDLRIVTEPDSVIAEPVVREVAARAGYGGTILVMPWSRALKTALEESGVMLYPTTRAPDREDHFHWVGPILSVKWVLYAKKGSGLRLGSLEEARQLRLIGTYRRDARELYLQEQVFTNLNTANSNIQNVRKLLKGRIQAMVSTDLGISTTLAEAGAPRDSVEPILVFRQVDLYMAFSRGTPPELVQRWREAYESIVEDGFLHSYWKGLSHGQ